MSRLREGVLGPLLATALGYLAWELYLALRPPDLTEQLREFLESPRGRFEQFYADWRETHGRDRADAAPPLGE